MEIKAMEEDIRRELSSISKALNIVHTHISMVFVADDKAIKVKKPVDFGFLDFTTLDRRHFFCHQELILNKRLAKDIYLDIFPIRVKKGKYSIGGGPGEIVDYAVVMKRIPEESLMKNRLIKGELKEQDLERIARLLADFHLNARSNEKISYYGRPEAFKVNTDENFEQTEKYIGLTISRETWLHLKGWTENFYKRMNDLFLQRISTKKIRDCHGDLHMEHIALMDDKIVIIDCIEFNERFRYGDILNDIAFLIMDMEYNGYYRESNIIWNYYSHYAEEKHSIDLLSFYKVYRAYVRGKVLSFQIDGTDSYEERQKIISKAKKYFELAHEYAQ